MLHQQVWFSKKIMCHTFSFTHGTCMPPSHLHCCRFLFTCHWPSLHLGNVSLPFWQYHLGKSDMVTPYVRYVRFQDPNWHPKRNWSTFSSHGEYCSYWFIPNAMVDLHQSLPKPCQKHSKGWGLAGSAAKRMVPSRIGHSKIKASE